MTMQIQRGGPVLFPFNVRAFGAMGDGTTDDTTAIQNCVNTAAPLGYPVWIPPGIYKTTSRITLPEYDNQYIYGPRSAILKPVGSTSFCVIGHDSGTDIANLTLEGFTINGNKSAVSALGSNAELLRLAQISQGLTVRNLYIYDSPDVALAIRSSSGHTMTGVHVEGNYFARIGADGLQDGAAQCMDLSPNGGRIRGASIIGNHAWGCRPLKIDNVTPRGCTMILLETNPTSNRYLSNIVVSDNTYYDSSSALVKATGMTDVNITGNSAYLIGGVTTTTAVYYITAVDSAQLVGNTALNTSIECVHIDDANNVKVSANFFTVDSAHAAVEVHDNCNDVVIDDNDIFINYDNASARGVLSGNGSGAQERVAITNNRIHVTVDPTAGAPLIEVSSIGDLTTIKDNILTSVGTTTTGGIKCANASTHNRIIDNLLGQYLNYSLGTAGMDILLTIDANGNRGIGTVSVGASMTGGVSMKNGTAPSGNVTDAFQHYAADQTAGNSAPHWRTENGDVVKLYKVGTYTQTYSTADRTHANPTASTLTMADGAGTNDNTIGAITADASVIAAFQELVDEINKLIADVADIKQLGNSVVDDLQALGAAG